MASGGWGDDGSRFGVTFVLRAEENKERDEKSDRTRVC